jgi:putative peptidoglycan lipid II flippase
VVGKEVHPSANVLRPGEPGADGESTGVMPPGEMLTGEVPSLPAVPPTAPAGAAEEAGRAFARHSAIMSVGTGLSRLSGFLRLAALAYALGVTETRLADTYNIANTTPNIIYELALGGILSSVFIPVFVEWLEGKGREEAWYTARAVLTFTALFLGAVMLIGIAFSGLIIRAYTFRVPGPQRAAAQALASFFLRWFMPQIVFYGIGAVVTGLLNAHRRFAVPMFAPILNNLLVAGTFFLFAFLPGPAQPSPDNITNLQRYVLAVGTTLGVVAMTAALWPSLRRLGFRWRWTLDLKDAGLRRIGRLAGWAFLYVAINQIGYLVVIVLAAGVRGGYSAYVSAFIFFQLPHAIFAVSIMTALLPSLSSKWAERDSAGFRVQLSQGIRATALIIVPAAFGYLALATPIVRLLLQHGATKPHSTEVLAGVLTFFSIGLFSFSSFQLFLRAFYAMQDTRTPALINVFAVGLNTAVNLVYFRFLGVRGLALGHATAYTFAAITAAVILRRRLGGIDGRRLAASLVRISRAGVITGAAALGVSHVVGVTLGITALSGRLLQVGAGVGAGVGAFLVAATALRVKELQIMKELLVSRVGRR